MALTFNLIEEQRRGGLEGRRTRDQNVGKGVIKCACVNEGWFCTLTFPPLTN